MYKKILFFAIFISILFLNNCNNNEKIESDNFEKTAKMLENKIKNNYNKDIVKELMVLYTNNIEDFKRPFEIAEEYYHFHKNYNDIEKITAISFYNYSMAYLFNDENMADSILILMDKAIALDSTYAKAYLLKGKMLAKTGFPDAAEEYLTQAIQKDTLLIDGYMYLANIAFLNENAKKAQDYYLKIIAIDSTYYECWVNLGILYYNTANYNYAIYTFKKAISFDSLGIVPYDYLVNMYNDGNLVDSAFRYAELFQKQKEKMLKKKSNINDNTNR